MTGPLNRVNIPRMRAPLSRKPFGLSLKIWDIGVLALLPLVSTAAVRGDDFPILRGSYVMCAKEGYVCALVSPWKGTTTVIDLAPPQGRIIWSVPAAGGKAYFSPDAKFLVFASDSRQLLPTNATRSAALVTFWSASHSTTVRFEDLFALVTPPPRGSPRIDMTQLEEVEIRGRPWLHWGDYIGFDKSGRFQISMFKQGIVLLDPATGRRVKW